MFKLPKRLFSSKRSRWPLLVALLFLLIALPIAFWLNSRTPKVEAAWWNAGWQYRKRVAVTNSGSATTNQRVTITLDTQALISANKMQADCDDLRVTDASGKLLEHWITGNATHTCNTATTYVYVKLPALPASGSTLYFYYGSPSAVDAEVTLGKSNTPGLSCQDILDHGNSIGTGLYYIAPSGNDTSLVEAYCDMTTSGGGWTLIISQQNNIILTDYYATPPRLTNDGAISYYINNDLKNVSESIWVTNQGDQTHTFTTSDFTGPLITNATSFADAADLSTNGLLAGNNSPVVNHFQVGQVCASASCHVAASSSTTYCNPVAQIWDWNAPDDGATINNNAHFGCKSAIESGWARRGKWLFVKGLHNFSSNTSATLATEETTPGPILYWKFDDGNGTQAKDSTTNQKHGTLTGGPVWKPENECVSGGCLYFDGSNDIVTSGNIPQQARTLSAWVKKTGVGSGAYNPIVFKGSAGTGTLYEMRLLQFSLGYFEYGTNAVSGQHYYNNMLAFPDNQWFHVAATYNDVDFVLYINGKEVHRETLNSPMLSINSPLYVGGGANNFKGFIDEVKAYPYALTADQILQDYNLGFSTVVGQQDQGSLSDGLTGYWKMDEASWNGTSGEVIDSSGNGNNGTASGGVTTGIGKYGNGGVFDGTDDYINGGSGTSLDATTLTLSAWIKPTTIVQYDGIVSKMNTPAYLGWSFSFDTNNRLRFTNNSDINILSNNNAVSTGTWQHIVFTYDSSGRYTFYVNGVSVGSGTDPGTLTPAGRNLTIGRYYENYNGYYLDGLLDQVRIYNRALLPDEVSKLYTNAPGPVGHWKLDDGSGTTVVDSSGNSLNLGTVNGPTWAPGKFGGAMSFVAASSQYATIADNAILEPSSQLTLSTWIKRNGTLGTRQIFMGKGNGNSDTTTQYWFEFDTSNRLVFYLSTGGVGANLIATDLTVTDTTTWHHVAAVWNGNITNVYLDGKKSTVAGAKTGSLTSCTYAFSIGKLGDFSGLNFNGLMDDTKVYNYARTTQQIMEDINAGHPAGGSPVGSQVYSYKFDEGTGTQAHDSVGSNTGTLENGPLWIKGKFGKALNFKVSTRMTLATPFGQAGEQTVTLWYKRDESSASPTWRTILGHVSANYHHLILQETSRNLGIWDGSFKDFGYNPPNDGLWHHYAVIYNSGTSAQLYVDGTYISQVSTSLNLVTYPIGSIGNWTTSYYAGPIDEVKFYTSALTPEQILIDMNQNQAMNYGAGGDAEAAIMTDGAGNPPIGEWKLDEGTGTVAKDTSGNGKDGTHAGAGWGVGKYGNAANFDGNDNISIPNMTGLGSTSFTIQGWMNIRSQVAGYSSMILSSTSGFVLYFTQTTKYPIAQLYNGTGWTAINCASNVINFNEWHHVALAYDETTTSMSLFYDGKKCAGPTTVSGGFNNGYNSTFNIGTYASNYHDGLIDDVKVYDYARTAGQVAYDYDRGQASAHWKLDECEGGTIHDSNGTNHGTWAGTGGGTQTSVGTCSTSGTAWGNGASGKFNASLNFDGTDDEVAIPHSLSLLPASSISLSAWVKYVAGNQGYFISKCYGACSGQAYFLRISSNAFHFNAVSSQGNWVGNFVFGTLSPGTWYHVVLTYDGATATATGYIDGKQMLQTDLSADTGIYQGSGASLYLGSKNAANFFAGQLDEPQIFPYVLSLDQVTQLYNEGYATRFGE